MNRTATEITRPDFFPSISLAMKESPLPCTSRRGEGGPRQHGPDEYPEGSGQVVELGRQEQAREGARRSDGREVVAEENVPVGRMVVTMVIQDGSRDCAPGVQTQDFIRYEEAIVPIGQGKSAQGYNYKR